MIQKNELTASDIEAAKAAYLANGGQITRCPTKNLGSKQLKTLGRTKDGEVIVAPTIH